MFVDGTRVGGGRPRRGGGAGADRAGLASRATSAASPPPASPAAGPGSRPRICVLGGGFGGLYTALRLEALRWPEGRRPEVTLIDKSDRFVFKPLLYELLNGTAQPEEVAPQFSELLGPTAVRFVRGRVREVEHAGTVPGSAGRVVLGDGTVVEYDWIVLALGSEGTHRGVPGAKDHALPFTTLEDTTRIKDEIQKLQVRERRRKHGICMVWKARAFPATRPGVGGWQDRHPTHIAFEGSLATSCHRVGERQRPSRWSGLGTRGWSWQPQWQRCWGRRDA